MNKFIKKTVTFLVYPFLLIAVVLTFNFFSNRLISHHAIFKISNSIKYVVIGHSHTSCAFNDSLIDNCLNIARSGDSYFYNYFKIKKILEFNNQIETVFVEFTNNQLGKRFTRIWDSQSLSNGYPLYAPFMEKEDLFILLSHNLEGCLALQKVLFKRNYNCIRDNSFDYIKANELGSYFYNNLGWIDNKKDKTKLVSNINTPVSF